MNKTHMPSLPINATRIDPRAHVAEQVLIGPDCEIQSGAHLGKGLTLKQGVHVDANAVFVDAQENQRGTQVEQSASIGANSTIYPGITIGACAQIRPGSVVTRSVPPNAIVEGNPASIVGYVGVISDHTPSQISTPDPQTVFRIQATPVQGVSLYHFPLIPDMRGSLTVCEFEKQIPFIPKRSFMVFDVPSREVRGEHAHHRCHQFLICVHGSCSVMADDGQHKVEVVLDAPNLGIYLPPRTWGVQYKYSADALLLVFASDYYDASDYIRNYDDFLQLVSPNKC